MGCCALSPFTLASKLASAAANSWKDANQPLTSSLLQEQMAIWRGLLTWHDVPTAPFSHTLFEVIVETCRGAAVNQLEWRTRPPAGFFKGFPKCLSSMGGDPWEVKQHLPTPALLHSKAVLIVLSRQERLQFAHDSRAHKLKNTCAQLLSRYCAGTICPWGLGSEQFSPGTEGGSGILDCNQFIECPSCNSANFQHPFFHNYNLVA